MHFCQIKLKLAFMKLRLATLMFAMISLPCQLAMAMTPWERWIEKPTHKNAVLVREITYSRNAKSADFDPVTTRNLRLLSRRVMNGNFDALQIAVRLSQKTDPGANLEDLYAMLGEAAGRNSQTYLLALSMEAQVDTCPGIGFLGEKFVDNNLAREEEMRKRKRSLLKIHSPALSQIQSVCLREIANDR